MDLAQASLEPSELPGPDAAFEVPVHVGGVEQDDADRDGAVEVVGSISGLTFHVPAPKTVTRRAPSGLKVSLDEVPPADAAPAGVGDDIPGRSQQELRRLLGERVDPGQWVGSQGQVGGLMPPQEHLFVGRSGQRRTQNEPVVVAEARQPGHG